MRSVVVVTGTSTGIGWGTAKVLIAHGFRVFGSVRKASDAERLSAEFGELFVPLLFDVTDEAAVDAAAAQVRGELGGEKFAGLVNNAGVAVAGPLLDLPIEDFRRQIDINFTGVVITTRAFAPLSAPIAGSMVEPGRIINISSVGGKIRRARSWRPMPPRNSRWRVLSECLRRELLPFGIDVIVIAPGAVATPIWGKAEQLDITPYPNTPYATALERMRTICSRLARAACRRSGSAKRCCAR